MRDEGRFWDDGTKSVMSKALDFCFVKIMMSFPGAICTAHRNCAIMYFCEMNHLHLSFQILWKTRPTANLVASVRDNQISL